MKDESLARPRPRPTAPARPRAPRPSGEIRQRLGWLIDALGNNEVAALLGVSRSQPSRWRRGSEGIAAENQRALVDLDYVVARLHQLYLPAVAAVWLRSPNAHLGGAVPVDVLARSGARDVVRALDAEAQGAYA